MSEELPRPYPRTIWLLRRIKMLWVTPNSPLPLFPEFELPRLPLSLVQALSSAGDQFWTTYRCCVAFTLTIDPIVGCWSVVPPTQHCGPTRSIWEVIPGDSFDLGTHVLAGSYQTARLERFLDAADVIPPMDGVHLVVTPHSNLSMVFLRVQGQATLAKPADLFIDDFQDWIVRYRDRFLF